MQSDEKTFIVEVLRMVWSCAFFLKALQILGSRFLDRWRVLVSRRRDNEVIVIKWRIGCDT